MKICPACERPLRPSEEATLTPRLVSVIAIEEQPRIRTLGPADEHRPARWLLGAEERRAFADAAAEVLGHGR